MIDLQKEIDAKLAACDAEIENRKKDLALVLRNMEDEADGRVADKKAEAQKYAAEAVEARKEVEHLHESRARIEVDIATLKLTLPELRKELEAIQAQNTKNLEEHQVRLANLRVQITEGQEALHKQARDNAVLKNDAEAGREAYTNSVNALLADANSLTATRARLEGENTRLMRDTGEKTTELNNIIADCSRAQQRFTAIVEERAVVEQKLLELTAKTNEMSVTLDAQKAALCDLDAKRASVAMFEQTVADRDLASRAEAARLNQLKEVLNKKEKDLAALAASVK